MIGNRVISCSNMGISARYWRILATDNSYTHNISPTVAARTITCWRISFWASNNATGTDLCLGKTALSSADYSGYPNTFANDNDGATRWVSAYPTTTSDVFQWWGIDLGVGNVSQVHSFGWDSVVLSASWTYLPKSAVLQYSNDGINWYTQKSIPSVSNNQAFVTYLNL